MVSDVIWRKGHAAGSPSSGVRRSRLREAALPTLAGGLVLLASLINFLTHNDYPLLRLEVGMVVVAVSGTAVIVGLIYAGGEKIGRALLQILLVYLAFDLNFDGL